MKNLRGRHEKALGTRWSAAGIGAVLLFAAAGCTSVSDEIQGVWMRDVNSRVKGMKVMADGKWFISYYDAESGLVGTFHGGSYTMDGNRYVETFDFACSNTLFLVGEQGAFDVSVEGDTFHQEGIDNQFSEDWQRVRQPL